MLQTHTKSLKLIAALVFSMGFCSLTFAQNSVELCLALDGSGSVSATDFDLQLEGYASAIENSNIVPRNSSVSIIVVQFSSAAQLELGPVLIDGAATAQTLANDIRNITQLDSLTDIASSIDECTSQFQYLSGFRQIIDISTDGQDSSTVVTAADNAVAAGVDAINALGVGSGIDTTQLESLVRPQPASAPPEPGFVVTVTDFASFTPAIEAKIQAEVTGGGPATPVPAMMPFGLLVLILGVLALSVLTINRRG